MKKSLVSILRITLILAIVFLLLFIINLKFRFFGNSNKISIYHIGNSLTWDSQPNKMEQVYAEEGLNSTIAYHIDSGKSINYISENPSGSWEMSPEPIRPYGQWNDSLTNHKWDYIILQPKINSDISGEIEGLINIINYTLSNPKNKNTNFYIYSGWITLSENYSESWENISQKCSSHEKNKICGYPTNLKNELHETFPNVNIDIIPTGRVLYKINQELQTKNISGIDSIEDIYRDKYHLKHTNGRYIAHTTTLSTILEKNPSELKIKSLDVDPEFKNLTDKIIWEVIK